MKKTALIIITILISFQMLYADSYYERGRTQYVYKNFDNARELFLKSAESYSNGNSYYFLGEIEKLEENYDKALEYYELAIEKDHILSKYLRNAYWNIIVIADQSGDINRVIRTCRSMWNRLKDQSAKRRIENTIDQYLWTDNEEAIEIYQEGLSLQDKGDHEGAEQHFRRALSRSSSFHAPRVELGLAAYRRGDLSQAASYLSPVSSAIHFYADIQLVMGDIRMKQQNWSQAVRHLDRVFEFGLLDSSTELTALLRRANSYHKMRRYDQAAEDLERALEINPDSLSAVLLLASININSNNYEEALKNLRKAERMDRNNPFILLSAGEIYQKQEDERFASYFQRLLNNRDKENPPSRRETDAYIALMKHYYENGKYKKAADTSEAIPENYMNNDLRLIIAYSRYNIKEYEKAITRFKEIHRLSEDDHLAIARAYSLKGNRSEAKKYLSSRYSNRSLMEAAEEDKTLASLVKEIRETRNEALKSPEPEPGPEPEKKPADKQEDREEEPPEDPETGEKDTEDPDPAGDIPAETTKTDSEEKPEEPEKESQEDSTPVENTDEETKSEPDADNESSQ